MEGVCKMKKMISLLTVFTLLFSGVCMVPAEELISGENIPEQEYVEQVSLESAEEDLTDALEDGVAGFFGETDEADEAAVDDPEIASLSDSESTESEHLMVSEAKDSGTCGDDVTWVLENGVLTISGAGEMWDYKTYSSNAPWYKVRATITEVIIKPGITHIGDAAFYWCSNLTSVTIPDTVTSLGAWSFDWCDELESITIPNSVTEIGQYAFWQDSGLKSITLPDSVEEVGQYAFSKCVYLASVKLSKNLTFLGRYAFEDCCSLTSIVIPGSLPEISESAFVDCSDLVNVTIENGVTTIQSGAFMHTGVKSIKIPDSVKTLRSYAFASCTSLVDLTIGNGLTEIESYAFSGCTSLKNVTIPQGVRTIGQRAFGSCSSLVNVFIPASVTRINSYAFEECTSLRDVYFGGTQYEWWVILIEKHNDLLKNATIHYQSSGIPDLIPVSAMQKVEITYVYNSQKGGDIRWKQGGKGVTGYVVYRQRSAEGIKKVATINSPTTTQCIDTGIVTGCWGRVYHYYVCALYGSREGPKSDKLVLQRLAPMKITSLQNTAAGKVTIKYTCTVNENKALGYEIQYAQTKQDLFDRKGTFKKVSVSGRKNLSKVISGFTKGKTYYFRVRCYVDYEHSITHQKTKTWSQYSGVVSVKITK